MIDDGERPSRFASYRDRTTLEEISSRWPNALEWFDVQCPHLAAAPDLVFRASKRKSEYDRVEKRYVVTRWALTAQADAAGDYGDMLCRHGSWRDPRPAMRARWLPELGLWVRCTTHLKSTPRRECPRPWPTVAAVPDLSVDHVIEGPGVKIVVQRPGVIAVPIAPNAEPIRVGDFVVLDENGARRSVGSEYVVRVEAVDPVTGHVLVRLG